MTPEAKAVFDQCDLYLDGAMKAYDDGVKSIPLPLRTAARVYLDRARCSYRAGLRDAYLTAVWEMCMGRSMPWTDGCDWEAEIQAALENRFS